MPRIPPPFAQPTRHWQIYRSVYRYTSLSTALFAPTLAFSCLLIGFIPPLTYSISQGCCGQIGRLVVWLPPLSMLAEVGFYLTNDQQVHADTEEHDGTHTHWSLYGVMVAFDQRTGLVMVSLWSAPLVICLMCFICSWCKFYETWKAPICNTDDNDLGAKSDPILS